MKVFKIVFDSDCGIAQVVLNNGHQFACSSAGLADSGLWMAIGNCVNREQLDYTLDRLRSGVFGGQRGI